MDLVQTQPTEIWVLETMPMNMLVVRFWDAVHENRVDPSQSPGRELQLAWRQHFYTEHGEGWGDATATCQTHQGDFVTPMIFFTECGGFSM